MATLALVPTCRPLLPSIVGSGVNEQMEPHTEEIEEFMRVEVGSWGIDEYVKAFHHEEMRQDVVRNLVTKEEADSDLSNASVTIRVVSAEFRKKKGVWKTKCLVTVGSHVVLETGTVKNTGSPEWTAFQSLNRIDVCESDENGVASNVVGTGIVRVKELRGVKRQRTVCLALQGGKSGYLLLSLAYSDSKERESRLLEHKYSVAGGSVRLMFNVTIDTAITQVKRLVHNTRNVIPHLVYGSNALPNSTDQLLARYAIPHTRNAYCLLSRYVALSATYWAKQGQVVRLEQVFTKDTSKDYCTYSAWIISSLQHTGVEIAESKTVLPVGKVAFFDPRAPVIDDLPRWTWWVPIL